MLNNAPVHCCRWIDPLTVTENRTVIHKASAEAIWRKELATENQLLDFQKWFIDCVTKFPAEFTDDDLANPKSLAEGNYQARFQMEGWRKLAVLTLSWFQVRSRYLQGVNLDPVGRSSKLLAQIVQSVIQAYRKATQDFASCLQSAEIEGLRGDLGSLLQNHLLARCTAWESGDAPSVTTFPHGVDTLTEARQRVSATLRDLRGEIGPGDSGDWGVGDIDMVTAAVEQVREAREREAAEAAEAERVLQEEAERVGAAVEAG